MKKLAYIFILLASTMLHAYGQERPGNLNTFDSRRLHWGIQVGYTQSKFDLHYTQDDSIRHTILGTTSYYSPGFHIHVIGDLRLGEYFNLRLLPGITLISRDMSYNWSEEYTSTHWKYDTKRTVESVYGEIPFELKIRAKRYANFRPYITTGGSWGYDVSSLFKNQNNGDESIIRLNPTDLRYTMGVGFDFFLRYVKFAIELKMAFGINDLRVNDNDYYTLSTTDLRSRTFMLSFTFEG
ncbi:MAG: outer membrane beta-barrel protein [Bacteroidales bacterium]|nr:outer membrane beta-barrel protein [Bacteroidales bacterium]